MGPHGVRQNLQNLLRLRIAVRIAQGVGRLEVGGIAGGAVEVVGGEGEASGVVAESDGAVGEDVAGWAEGRAVGAAPGGGARVDDHLAVAGDVGGDIAVAGTAVVLPAAADVGEIELTARTAALDHV